MEEGNANNQKEILPLVAEKPARVELWAMDFQGFELKAPALCQSIDKPNHGTISPSILIDGETYYPPGWMYVLAFALRGVQWAIDEIESGKTDANAEYWWKHGCQVGDNLGAGI